MRPYLKSLLRYLSAVLVSLVILSFVAFAQNVGKENLTVVATVLPVRIIVVDNNFVIKQIISNTEEDVRPLVVLNTQDGKEVPYTDSIRKQYDSIKKSISFVRPGLVYERKTTGTGQLFINLYHTIRKFLGF